MPETKDEATQKKFIAGLNVSDNEWRIGEMSKRGPAPKPVQEDGASNKQMSTSYYLDKLESGESYNNLYLELVYERKLDQLPNLNEAKEIDLKRSKIEHENQTKEYGEEAIKSFYGWQKLVYALLSEEPNSRVIYFLYEVKGNIGKSHFKKVYTATFPDCTIALDGGMNERDIKSICSQKEKRRVLIYDIARSMKDSISYACMEDLKSGSFCNTKYKTSVIMDVTPPHIVVFSNGLPDIDALSEDRYRIGNIVSKDKIEWSFVSEVNRKKELILLPQWDGTSKNLEELVEKKRLEILNSREVTAPSIPETSAENNVEDVSKLQSANETITIETSNPTETTDNIPMGSATQLEKQYFDVTFEKPK